MPHHDEDMNSSTPAVSIDGVVKRFGAVTAVDGLSLKIQPGEVVAFLGPNGAGKTTTVDMILGLSQPSEGSVQIFGGDPRKAVALGRVAAVMQTGGLLKDFTVRETVELTASLFRPSRPVDEVLDRAGILDIGDRMVGKASGGQQQRLRFALALLSDPDLLILDEPTTGMDVQGRRDFWNAIRSPMSRMPARSSTSSTGREGLNSDAVSSTVSRTVKSLSRPPVCMTAVTRPWATALRGVPPNTSAVPASGRERPSTMSIVEVLPAPLGPRKATISPCSMARSRPSTAVTVPKRLVSPRRAMAGVPARPVAAAAVNVCVMPRASADRGGISSAADHDSPMTGVTVAPPRTAVRPERGDQQTGSFAFR